MNRDSYLTSVVDGATADGYEEFDVPNELALNWVYGQRVTSARFGGLAYKFIATPASDDLNREVVWDAADDLRSLMTDESFNVLGFGENMVGYLIAPFDGVPADVERFITDEYDNHKGTAFVFPVAANLEAEEVVTHPVPRVKQRTAYSAQQKDAENYFDVWEDGDSGGFLG